MVSITTVALIERRVDVSRELFSRYWRDVHGVMAARIPGFADYTQHHVTPLSDAAPPFEGIAIVTFGSEDDRLGLATSEITRHIHRDEQNVFRRAMLYNLDADALKAGGEGDRMSPHTGFVVLSEYDDADAVHKVIEATEPLFCDVYELQSGDPAGWNNTDASGEVWIAVMHAGWTTACAAKAGLEQLSPALARYRVDAAYKMVERGFPTPVGLRGLDAVRTIYEANADNQLSGEVVRAIYGPSMAMDRPPQHPVGVGD
ncbi:EthD domain-containing protein [Blastomonas fulva]|jgi:hypothetical protein|uniref:EthD domain-containing protein n=1 Tax=Blastomonas fulva TaxID=1550728 RepID=UPI003F7265A9